jgi:tRNA(Arg) A34 adenosine deaminase TadA
MADNNKTGLPKFIDKSVAELITLPLLSLSPAEQERHRIYSLMLMALVFHYWNGNKKGRLGTYPLNESSAVDNGKHRRFLEGDYLGHNIAAIAVDGDGHIIDFEFNHNALMNSSVEHAESRLVRRIFSLTQIHDSWNTSTDKFTASDDYNTFEKVTVYTSLEPCSQCAGIMALARVKQVIYLQTDSQMNLIGNILRNLTVGTKLESPIPIKGSEIGLPFFDELHLSFEKFFAAMTERKGEPFFQGESKDFSASITSYLCTKEARNIYKHAAQLFEELAANPSKLESPKYPYTGTVQDEKATTLSNLEVLREAFSFLRYATASGRRATPHKL